MGIAAGQDEWNIQIIVNLIKDRDLMCHTVVGSFLEINKALLDSIPEAMSKKRCKLVA